MSIRLSCGITVPDAVLAPMEGVMSATFVSAASQLNLVNLWITPFISVNPQSVPSLRILKRRLEPFVSTGRTVIPQIMGRDPDPILRCTELLKECGFVAVNLNFCCPSPRVTFHGGGSAMLSKPEEVKHITEMVRSRFPDLSLSVKLRAGWNRENIDNIVHAVCDGGAEWIIFHFRTGKELYSPVPDGLKRIEKAVKAAGNVPVYGNGDIRSPGDMNSMMQCGCTGVAAGRGFLFDPELIRKLNGEKISGLTRKIFLLEMSRKGAPDTLIRKLQRYAGVAPEGVSGL